jgi:hypothetical protein
MLPEDSPTKPQPPASAPVQFTPPPIINLQPLLEKGQAAIPSDPVNGVANIHLTKLEATSNDVVHKTTVIIAHDLFASLANEDRLIPEGSDPTAATLTYQVAGSHAPHTVELRLPATVRLEHPADAPRIGQWLISAGFAVASSLAQLGLALLLLMAASPWPDDDDTDDDDDEATRPHFTLRQAA